MEKKYEVMFVVNPASGNGRTFRKWQAVEKKLRIKGYQFQASFTERQLHASQITEQALQDGYDHIIAVGGDGTINEVVNGFYCNNHRESKSAALSVVPMGTGSDFSRHLGLSSQLSYIEKLLVNGNEQACDVVKAAFKGWDGKETCRYFINVADVGIGSETVYRVNRSSKAWGGFLSFFSAAISSVFSFVNPELSVEVDGKEIYSGRSTLAVVSNGRYFGGGVMISPYSQVDDGLLDVHVFEGLSKLECLRLIPGIYKGRHTNYHRLHIAKGKEVTFSSQQKIYLELDGESPGTGDVQFRVLPADMKLLL